VEEQAACVLHAPTCPLAGLNGHVAAAACVDAISWLAPKPSATAIAALNRPLETAAGLIMGSSREKQSAAGPDRRPAHQSCFQKFSAQG
jgi:hypothetical protein